MHFGLSEEQALLQETLRGFIEAECPPTRLRELFDEGAAHDLALWKGLAEIGLPGLCVPESEGGAGLGALELALCCEELGAGALPGPLAFHALATLGIRKGGSPTQREHWLPALASGERVASIALEGVGGCIDDLGERPVLDSGALAGVARHVPFAEVADLFVVALSNGGLAVVESDASGLAIEAESGIDRTRPLGTLRFDETPAEPLEDGAKAFDVVRDATLSGLAADAFGAAWALVRMTVEYAKTRHQFGRPIAEFQSVKHQLADMATTIELSRGLYWHAAYACDHVAADAPRQAALAKAHIGGQAVEVARQAVELHGGLGFTWECDVQLWFKRALFDRAFLGNPDEHRDRAASLGGY